MASNFEALDWICLLYAGLYPLPGIILTIIYMTLRIHAKRGAEKSPVED
jgi:hypothetical protein